MRLVDRDVRVKRRGDGGRTCSRRRFVGGQTARLPDGGGDVEVALSGEGNGGSRHEVAIENEWACIERSGWKGCARLLPRGL